jgi:MraZ protein
MLAGAVDVELDKQGRVLIPDYLKDYAGLKKDVTVAGLFDRLEIWDKDKWNSYKAKAEKNSDEIAEQLGKLGVY